MNLLSKSLLGAVVALITTNAASAQIINGNLETTGGALYTGSPYADQTLVGFGYNSNVVGNGEPFSGYLTDANNYQIYQTSSAGATGSFAGPTVIQVNSAGVKNYTLESIAPVVASIAPNKDYQLTFAIANDGGGAGNVTLSLFSATSAVDTTNYSIAPYGNDPNTGNPYPATSPLPVITTGTVFTSDTVPNYTINAQVVGNFTDYTVSLNTFAYTFDGQAPDLAAIGQNLYIGLNVDNNGSLQFDNIRLKVLPEPSTWALMLVGLCSLLFMARRRKALASRISL
jgi:hypothetical protein